MQSRAAALESGTVGAGSRKKIAPEKPHPDGRGQFQRKQDKAGNDDASAGAKRRRPQGLSMKPLDRIFLSRSQAPADSR